MKLKISLLAVALLIASPAFAISPQYLRNNSLGSTLNGENLMPGSAAVDGIGRQFGGWLVPSSLFQSACSTTVVDTTDTTIVAAPGAGNRIFVTNLSCANTSSVASQVAFKNGATVEMYGGIGTQAATGGGFQALFDAPWRLAQNTALRFAMATTATSTTCCAQYFVLAE